MINYEKSKKYSIEEAVKIVKENAKEKFDASIEVHIKLGIDTKKGEQQIRGSVSLPNGTGKSVRVAAFVDFADLEPAKQAGADVIGGEDIISAIKSTGKTDFDVAVAHPTMMAKLAQIAKILGPRGLMPSPKDGTVTQNIGKTVKELKSGRLSFKNDNTGNIHTIIGKKSFDAVKLSENFRSLYETIRKMKPSSLKGEYIKGIVIASTMGKGVKVSV